MHLSTSRRRFLECSAAGLSLLGGPIPTALAADESAPVEWPEHFFLTENFAPVHEEVTADKLPVVGAIPRELDGMFIRNGPNPQFPPLGNYHWFDGDGMLHGVRFQDGTASYRNRYVRTEGWKREHAAGNALWTGFSDPIELKEVAAGLLQGKQPFKNTANTSLVWHHGKLLALWELGFPHEVSVPELDTVGLYAFGGALRHVLTAHPKIDAQTGELLAIGYSPVPPYLQYSVFDPLGRVTFTGPIPVRRPVFMHDFAITERHTVLIESPAVFDPFTSQRGGEFVRYDPEMGARIGILPRHGPADQIRWFEIESCFVYHVLNAYEEGDLVHLFACRMPQYPRAFGLSPTVGYDDFADIYGPSKPVVYRWSCNVATGKVHEEPLDDRFAEYPRVNDRRIGRATRYGYVVTADAESSGLVKYDLHSGRQEQHSFGRGRIIGEAVYVPRPESTIEDDGWLVTIAFDRSSGKSECIVLEGRNPDAPPLARIMLPQRVPYGFHAIWLDGAVL